MPKPPASCGEAAIAGPGNEPRDEDLESLGLCKQLRETPSSTNGGKRACRQAGSPLGGSQLGGPQLGGPQLGAPYFGFQLGGGSQLGPLIWELPLGSSQWEAPNWTLKAE